MVNVYSWPPVAVVAQYWTPELPISQSRSLLTGASYTSAAQRRRLTAGFDIAGWPKYSAGYLEVLWRLLDGGVNLVRLYSCRNPYGSTVPNELRGGNYIDWEVPPGDVKWLIPPGELRWFDGTILQGTVTTSAGFPAVRVKGLPANSVVAAPGESLIIWTDAGEESHMILTEATSDANGVATIRLITRPSGPGQVSIGGRETAVFELVSNWPKTMTRLTLPENYGLEFREVFEDERGEFVEIDPWQ